MFHLRSVYDHLWILESLFLRVGYNTKVENWGESHGLVRIYLQRSAETFEKYVEKTKEIHPWAPSSTDICWSKTSLMGNKNEKSSVGF